MTDFDAEFTSPAPPPPPRPIEYADADPSGWWVSVVGGILMVLLGLWVLTNLYESVVVLAWLVGISLIVTGIVEVLALHGETGAGWAVWLSGGLLVAAGIVVMVWPDITLWVLAMLAGIALRCWPAWSGWPWPSRTATRPTSPCSSASAPSASCWASSCWCGRTRPSWCWPSCSACGSSSAASWRSASAGRCTASRPPDLDPASLGPDVATGGVAP